MATRFFFIFFDFLTLFDPLPFVRSADAFAILPTRRVDACGANALRVAQRHSHRV
jgi:hypothetical protein